METKYNHVSIQSLERGNIGIQVFAAWISPERGSRSPLEYGQQLIDTYGALLSDYSDKFVPILSYEDALRALDSQKIGCMLAIEGGDAIEGNIANIRHLYDLGVRLITLTWNHDNQIASGIAIAPEDDIGLTEFGERAVSEMNRLGIIVDISHISNRGFWDVCELSSAPIVASHSNAKFLCSHRRNLDNDQIRAIANSNGIMGINFYPPFLTDDTEAGLDDILRHIDYIAGLVGVEYIGFGSDFDGIDSTPRGIDSPANFEDIIEGLLKLNYREDDIEKICNGNMMRVLRLSL